MHAEERQHECSQRHSEVRAGRLSSQAQSVSHRTDQTSLESKRTPRDFPRRLFLYPLSSATARTAPNGVKERASFCLVFRSLNTSSHRMFSMGYRRAKSTQGNTNFQKRIFWQTTSGSLRAGLELSNKLAGDVTCPVGSVQGIRVCWRYQVWLLGHLVIFGDFSVPALASLPISLSFFPFHSLFLLPSTLRLIIHSHLDVSREHFPHELLVHF